METWVLREMGASFNPERHCQYTGKGIHPHPYRQRGSGQWRLMYWRVDGFAMRCREATQAEVAWLDSNPAEFARLDAQFQTWKSGLDAKRESP